VDGEADEAEEVDERTRLLRLTKMDLQELVRNIEKRSTDIKKRSDK
jgi:hypothetical protein